MMTTWRSAARCARLPNLDRQELRGSRTCRWSSVNLELAVRHRGCWADDALAAGGGGGSAQQRPGHGLRVVAHFATCGSREITWRSHPWGTDSSTTGRAREIGRYVTVARSALKLLTRGLRRAGAQCGGGHGLDGPV